MLQWRAMQADVANAVESLFSPRSLAIVGASATPGKWGHLLARGALAGAHRRDVHLVNRGGGEILGRPAFADVRDLPSPPELVVVTVPPAAFAEAVDGALEAGARAIVGITAGLGESGGAAQERESALVERVRAAGAVLLGPNCLGVLDSGAELELAPWIDFPPGEIGLIAQSGNVALELGLLAAREGAGLSRFASLGNQADLTAADLIANLARHEPTRVIALYVEDFRDGRAFASAAEAAVAAGKPVVLLAAGLSEAGERAARSHTGALASGSRAVDAACRAAGIVRVSTPRKLVDAAVTLVGGNRARGRRVAVFGDGGGHGVVAADAASALGLELPALSEPVRSQLASALPATAATANPVDFAGGETDFGRFERATGILLESGEVDALLLTGYFGGYGGELAEIADREVETAIAIAEAARDGGCPLVVHSLYPDSPAAHALRAHGALVFLEVERAVRALGWLARDLAPSGVPALPVPEELDSAGEDYFAGRALVARAGVTLAEARPVASAAELRAAAEELGFPLVLKSLAHGHKSDAGGVVLGITDEAELETAYAALAERLGPRCSLERMAQGELELIVGTRRDPRFGPLLLVGLGGIHAEALDDVAVALAPVDADAAEALLRTLRSAALFDGARGRPPVDIGSAARAAALLSDLAARTPWIQELEINPLLVGREGAVALDARVVVAD
jgi:acetate---CoA ligase (ADP-forming)